MKKQRSALVTGASGFIGQKVTKALKLAGWNVISAVRSKEHSNNVDNIYVDISVPESILLLSKNYRFDAIVHLGAKVGWNDSSLHDMFVPNVLSVGLLASLAKDWNALMVFSSAAIVCGVKTQKIDLNSEILLDTQYGKSKYLAEEFILASGARACILRIGGVFGYLGPGHLSINKTIENAIRRQTPIQYGSGEALRNYIYTEDVANSIVYSLENEVEGIHLLAGSESLSISKMLNEICNIFLPGKSPILKAGTEATSQVINSSVLLPFSRGFRDSLLHIKSEL